MKLLHIIVAIMLLVNTGFAQTINLDHFNKRIFTSDFNSAKDAKLWPSTNNTEELIILNNEKYSIERKEFTKDRIIFPNWNNAFPSFELTASVNLQYLTQKEHSAGICFAYSKKHETGFIIEINKKKKYRVKQINADGTIKFITGTTSMNSWKKSNMLYPKQESNQINILVIGNTIDIYLNNFFVYSFTNDFNYNFRDFGLYVGKGSKAIFHHVYLLINHTDYGKYDQNMEEVDFTKTISKEVKPIIKEDSKTEIESEQKIEKEQVKEVISEEVIEETEEQIIAEVEVEETEGKAANMDPDVKKCLDMIVNLRSDLSASQRELETTLALLGNCKDDNNRMNEFITMNMDNRLKNKAAGLELENERLKDEIQKLKSKNTTLQDFKDYYKDANKDEDIVNFLYDELKKIEEKNAFLARQVEILQEKLNK
ncbi:MAG: hypothetical protein HN921_00120 [Bacteroidetes bacterium]|nr:hypothetical protein [Bacteroidota bacterium]MBT3422251.1 hypothetical protein [Bacteroidota bacterium]MBT5989413.1 hypothetical protein [Bacteroidota bacterium]MBT7038217.1 hypothetical protein [Bacteroidota bacterium]